MIGDEFIQICAKSDAIVHTTPFGIGAQAPCAARYGVNLIPFLTGFIGISIGHVSSAIAVLLIVQRQGQACGISNSSGLFAILVESA